MGQSIGDEQNKVKRSGMMNKLSTKVTTYRRPHISGSVVRETGKDRPEVRLTGVAVASVVRRFRKVF